MSVLMWWAMAHAADEPPSDATGPLGLEQALARALEVSEDVELAEAGRERAAGNVTVARAGHFPTVGAQLSYNHQFSSEFDGLFDVPTGVPTGGTGTGTPTGTPTTPPTGDEEESTGLPFGQPDTWRVTFQATQPIWQGNRVLAQDKIARTSRDLADMSWRSTRAGVVLVVAQAFYDAALAERLLEIARSTLEQAETTLSHAELGSDVGRTAEFDVLRARVEVENQRVAVIQAERTRVTTRLVLANLLDLDPATLDAGADLESLPPVADLTASLVGVAGEEQRVAVEQAEASVVLSEQSLAVTRSYALPSLAATGQVGWVTWPTDVIPMDGDVWRDTVAVGATLTVPLFGGGAVGGQLKASKASIAEATTRLDQAREVAEAETLDAAEQLRAAEAQWAATSGTVEQAERAYAIADVRFREGVSTQVELSDARLLRQRALANRAMAARDLQVARIRAALLPLLPFQTAR